MTARCPSELRLEEYLLAPASSGVAAHVEGCAACSARVAEMRDEGAHFQQYVFPATVDAVVEAAQPRQSGWFRWLFPAAAVAAAAAVFLVRPVSPEAELAARGEKLTLEVFTQAQDGLQPVSNGGLVPPGQPIQFRVTSTVPCRLKVVAVDCEGRVSVLHPPPGEEAVAVTASGSLPGTAVLAGDEGPERIYALCAPEPLPMLALAARLTDQSAGDDDRVRRAGRLAGLPRGTLQATLLVEHGDEEPDEHHHDAHPAPAPGAAGPGAPSGH